MTGSKWFVAMPRFSERVAQIEMELQRLMASLESFSRFHRARGPRTAWKNVSSRDSP